MGTSPVGTQTAENTSVVRHGLKTAFFRSLLEVVKWRTRSKRAKFSTSGLLAGSLCRLRTIRAVEVPCRLLQIMLERSLQSGVHTGNRVAMKVFRASDKMSAKEPMSPVNEQRWDPISSILPKDDTGRPPFLVLGTVRRL